MSVLLLSLGEGDFINLWLFIKCYQDYSVVASAWTVIYLFDCLCRLHILEVGVCHSGCADWLLMRGRMGSEFRKCPYQY